MEVNVNVKVDIQDVWDEMSSAQKMDFLRWNLSEERSIDGIINECFSNSDIRYFINENLDSVDEDELIDELTYRGFIVTKE